MFETVLNTSCQIIESGWTKDRSPVDTFIMGLATSIRERNDYDEQVGLRYNDPTLVCSYIFFNYTCIFVEKMHGDIYQ